MKTDVVRARIEPELKKEVEEILEQLGLKTADAINLLFRQIKLTKGIPFPIHMPNRVTEKAIRDAENDIGLKTYNSVEELFNDLDKAANKKNKTVRKGLQKGTKAKT